MRLLAIALGSHFLCQGAFGFILQQPAHRLESSTKYLLEKPLQFHAVSRLQSSLKSTDQQTWQADLEELLSPLSLPGRKQILLQELLNANQDIRASVQQALQERNVR
jgi:hypothetical protein